MKNPRGSGVSPDFFSVQVREARRFYLDLAPPAEDPLAVVCFRRYEHQTPHQFLMRRKMHIAAERLQYPPGVGEGSRRRSWIRTENIRLPTAPPAMIKMK